MDSNEVKKRLVHDITPPAPIKSAPSLEIKKRQTIAVADTSEEQDVDILLPVAEKESSLATTAREKKIDAQPLVAVEPESQPVTKAEPSSPVEPPAALPVSEPVVAEELEAIVIPEPTEVPEIDELLESPSVDPLPEQSAEQPVEESTPQPEIDDKDTIVPEVFEASDALPDDSARSANALKDGMQDPTLYDTTAYHVPIKETHHSHGSPKASLTFGALFAVAVVGAAIYFMLKLGS